MTTFANTSTTSSGSSVTVTWTSAPEPPHDDPPAGVPARTGPRPSAPPAGAAARADGELVAA